ncbi:MAG: hypothetical protein AB7P78_12380 [Candidatus Binatia bacterium]
MRKARSSTRKYPLNGLWVSRTSTSVDAIAAASITVIAICGASRGMPNRYVKHTVVAPKVMRNTQMTTGSFAC